MAEGFAPSSGDDFLNTFEVVRRNLPFFAQWLVNDLQHVTADTGSEFVEVPHHFLFASLGMFVFLLKKDDTFNKDSEGNRHLITAGLLLKVLLERQEELRNPGNKYFLVRRDMIWIYFTALLQMFLNVVKVRGIILEEEYAEYVEPFRLIIGEMPSEWVPFIDRSNREKRSMSIAKVIIRGITHDIPVSLH